MLKVLVRDPGIGPLKLLYDRSRKIRCDKLVDDEGKAPDNVLLLSLKY